MTYHKISKREARELFYAGETIYLCPSNMLPGGGWSVECPVNISGYIDDAKRYEQYHIDREKSSYSAQYAHLWKGSVNATAWDLMYNNWAYYNTNYEMGYYAHYYRKG